jgi:hypothetical protein
MFRQFLRRFGLVALFTALAAFSLVKVLNIPEAGTFILLSWIFFSAVTLAAVYGCVKGMENGNFALFQGIYLGSVMGKVVFAGILVVIYNATASYRHVEALIPMALIYFPYLVLEVMFLSKASREIGPSSQLKKNKESA